MSYEGHVQHICANGHRFDTDCRDTETKCDCGAASAFHNDVDDTNCESWGVIPDYEWEKLLLTPEVRFFGTSICICFLRSPSTCSFRAS